MQICTDAYAIEKHLQGKMDEQYQTTLPITHLSREMEAKVDIWLNGICLMVSLRDRRWFHHNILRDYPNVDELINCEEGARGTV